MVRHSRSLAAAALVASVVVGGVVVSAQKPGFGSGQRRAPAGLALRALDLTEAQREQVRQLTAQHREQSRTLLGRLQAAQDARRKAVEAIPFNEPEVRTAAQALAEVEAELAVQQARLQADIYALLTPDQQTRLQTMRAERDARAKERMSRLQQRSQRRPQPQA
jgi:Spy/CpxP family protein refolding chaperone